MEAEELEKLKTNMKESFVEEFKKVNFKAIVEEVCGGIIRKQVKEECLK